MEAHQRTAQLLVGQCSAAVGHDAVRRMSEYTDDRLRAVLAMARRMRDEVERVSDGDGVFDSLLDELVILADDASEEMRRRRDARGL